MDISLFSLPQRKRFKCNYSSHIYVYHPLPHKDRHELLKEWKEEENERKKRRGPMCRQMFLQFHIEEQNTRKFLAKLMEKSNIEDMGLAKQWYWVVKMFPFDKLSADKKAVEMKLNTTELNLTSEMNEWIWSAERLSLLQYYARELEKGERHRRRNIEKLISTGRKVDFKKMAKVLSKNSRLSVQLRIFFESRQNLLFDYTIIRNLKEPTSRDVRDILIKSIDKFSDTIKKKFLSRVITNEAKKRMFDISLVHESTKAAFTSIQGYLKELYSLENLIVVQCTITDHNLTFPIEQIKENMKSAILSSSDIPSVRFSPDDVDQWSEYAARITDRLTADEILSHSYVINYKSLISNEKIPQEATEEELLDLLQHMRILQIRLPQAPQSIACRIFCVRLETVWIEVKKRLEKFIYSLVLKIRKNFSDHLSELLDEFRVYDRALLFRSINPELMLNNKALVNSLIADNIGVSVERLLAVYDRVYRITQHITLDPSQHDTLLSLAKLRTSIPHSIRDHQFFFKKRLATFQHYVVKRQSTVLHNVQKVAERTKIIQTMANPLEVESYLNELSVIRPLVSNLIKEIDDLNVFERVVSITVTDVPKMRQLMNDIEVMYHLFQATNDANKLMNDFYDSRRTAININRSKISIDGFMMKLAEYETGLSGQRAAKHFVANARNDVDRFKKTFPVMEVLSCRRLLDSHWMKMSEIVGFDISIHSNAKVSVLCELGLEDHLAQLKPIAFAAEREALVADQLEIVASFWNTALFTLIPTPYWKIDVAENLEMLSERAQRDRDRLSENRDAEEGSSELADSIKQWIATVTKLFEILTSWNSLQATWLRVARVFHYSKDNLDAEFILFRECGKYWKKFYQIMEKEPSVLKILEQRHCPCWLNGIRKRMNQIVKGVHVNFTRLRLIHPRLTLTSDHHMMELFSDTDLDTRLKLILKEAFPSFKQLDISTRGSIEIEDHTGDMIVIESITKDGLNQMDATQIISAIENGFINKINDLVDMELTGSTGRIPKTVTSLCAALAEKNGKEVLTICKMDSTYFLQHRHEQRQTKLSIDFVHYDDHVIIPRSISDGWSRGQYILLIGNVADTRRMICNISKKIFSYARFINCHQLIDEELFETVIAASLKESLLIILENVNQLSDRNFYLLNTTIGTTLSMGFARLILTSTAKNLTGLTNRITTVNTSTTIGYPQIETSITEETIVTISMNNIRDSIKERLISVCTGSMAKTVLVQVLNNGFNKVSWLYLDALCETQLLIPNTPFGCAPEGLILDLLNYEKDFSISENIINHVVIFYGYSTFWKMFPFLCSLLVRPPLISPAPYFSLPDGSTVTADESTHYLFCLPENDSSRLETFHRFSVPDSKFGEFYKSTAMDTYRLSWRDRLLSLVNMSDQRDLLNSLMDEVIFPTISQIQTSFDAYSVLFSIILAELSEILPEMKLAAVPNILVTVVVSVVANLMAIYFKDTVTLDEMINEKLIQWNNKNASKIPKDITAWKLSEQEIAKLVRWKEEPSFTSSLEKDSKITDLIVVSSCFDRLMFYSISFLKQGRHLIVHGPPFSQKTTLVKRIEKHISSSNDDNVIFEWLDGSMRYDLITAQKALYKVIHNIEKDQIKYLVVDKFSFAEPLLPVLEFFVDQRICVHEGRLEKIDNGQLRLILICEEEDWSHIRRLNIFYESFVDIPVTSSEGEDLQLLLEKMIAWNLSIKSFSSEYQSIIEPLASSIVYLITRDYMLVPPLLLSVRLVKALSYAFPDNITDISSFLRLWIHETLRVLADGLELVLQLRLMEDIRHCLTEYFNTTEKELLESFFTQSVHTMDDHQIDSGDMTSLLFSEVDAVDTVDGLSYILVRDMITFNRTIENIAFEYHRNHSRDMIRLAIDDTISRRMQQIARVLRQSNEHLVLAAAPRTGRQQTIKLALAAVNANLIHLYPDPSSFSSFLSGWSSIFSRSLQSIATANQHIVLLIHFDHLYERVEPRWMEYVRLWLDSPQTKTYLSDESLLAFGEQIVECEKSLASQMQSMGIRLPGQRQCRFLPIEVLRDLSALRRILESRVYDFLHVVFLVNPQFKADFPWCTVVNIQPNSPSKWQNICSKILADCGLTTDVIQLLVDIFTSTKRLLLQTEEEQSAMLFDFCTLFKDIYVRRKSHLTKSRKSFSEALKTMQNLKDLQQLGCSHDAKILEDRLISNQEEKRSQQMILKENGQKLEIAQQTLRECQEKLEEYENQKLLLSNDIEATIKEPLQALNSSLHRLNTFGPAEFKKMSLLQKPTLGTKFVAEILRSLFTSEFKPSRNTAQVWLDSQKFLRTHGLLHKISIFDPETLSLEETCFMENYLEKRVFKEDKIAAESALGAALYAWIVAATRIARTSLTLGSRRAALTKLQSLINEVQDKIEELKTEIEKVQDAMEKSAQTIRDKELSIANDNKLSDYQSRSVDLINVLKPHEERWTSDLADIVQEESQLFGNSIIMSAYRTMLNGSNLMIRKRALAEWKETFESRGIDYNRTRNTSSSLMESILRNIHQESRFPFFIDKLNILPTVLKSLYHNSVIVNLENVDWKDANLMKNMAKYIFSATPTIFTNFSTCPPCEYYELLMRWEQREIRFGDRLLELPDDVLFIFVTNKTIKLDKQFEALVDVFVIDEVMEITGSLKEHRDSDELLLCLVELSASSILESQENTRKVTVLATNSR